MSGDAFYGDGLIFHGEMFEEYTTGLVQVELSGGGCIFHGVLIFVVKCSEEITENCAGCILHVQISLKDYKSLYV